MNGRLLSRNVTVDGHRTSLRLERATWEAIDDICRHEGMSLHEVCSLVEPIRNGISRTATVRAFTLNYFRLNGAKGKGPDGGVFAKALKVMDD